MQSSSTTVRQRGAAHFARAGLAATVAALTAAATLSTSVLVARADEPKQEVTGAAAQAFELAGTSSVNNIKVNWQGSDASATYTISRAEGSNGDFKVVAQNVKGKSYDDYGLAEGKTYTYKVEPTAGGAAVETNAVMTQAEPKGLAAYDNTKAGTVQGKSGIKVGDTYYLYSSKTTDGKVDVIEQTSKDDENWGEGRVVIGHDDFKALDNAKLESFGAHYNETTKKVVIWAHYENASDYTEAKVFTTSGTPGKDDFTKVEPFRPQNNESRDLSFFADADGSAYLISSTNNNADQAIYKLSKDWTELADEAGVIVNKDQRREAPSMVHEDDYYYLFTSGTNGWYPTQGQYISAKSVKALADATPQNAGNSQTYGAQSGGLVKYGDSYVVAANRWSGGWKNPDPALNGDYSSQRLLPVSFNNGFAAYNYYSMVKIGDAGVVPVQSGRIVSVGKTIVADQTTEAGKNEDTDVAGAAENANDGLDDDKAAQYIPSGSGAYTWTVDLGKLTTISQVDVTFHEVRGSDTYAQYQIKGSKDGVNYMTLADKSSNTIPGFNETLISDTNQYRYLQIAVSATKRVDNNASAETWWQRGFKEVTVYGDQTSANYDGGTYTGVPVGEDWYDTSGNPIQAHGGGFLQDKDADGNTVYYWVGEDKSHNSANFKGVNLYKSTDLLNWTFVKAVLTPETKTAEGAEGTFTDVKFERPKILKNANGQYVLWSHWEDATGYTSSQVAVAIADQVDGPYTVLGHWRPGARSDAKYRNWRAVAGSGGTVYISDKDYLAATENGTKPITDANVWKSIKDHAIKDEGFGLAVNEKDWTTTPDPLYGDSGYGFGSRDFTLYQDGEDAYAVTCEDYQQMRIHKLNADFTDVAFNDAGTKETMTYRAFPGQRLEAPGLFKHEGKYYIVISKQSGWYPNQARYYVSDDIADPDGWTPDTSNGESPKLIGNNSTWYSQPTSIMTINAGGKDHYVYLGDRWVPSRLGSSSYIWLPLSFDEDDNLTMDYVPGWKLNAKTGDIELPDLDLVSEGKKVYAEDGVPADGQPKDLVTPEKANDGNVQMDSFWNSTTNEFYRQNKVPYTWTVDLGEVRDLNRVDTSFAFVGGSEARYGYLIKGTNDPIASKADADKAQWTVLSDQRENKTVAFKSDKVTGKYRYVQIEVISVSDDAHNGNAAHSWQNGLVEVQVYANKTRGELTALPEASVKSGTYTSDQKIELSVKDEKNATIHYTTDGSTPTASSPVYAGPITVTKGTTTVKAIAIAEGKQASGVMSWTYTVIDPNDITGLQKDQATAFAVTPTEGAEGLPKTLKAITAEGKNKDDAAVTWDASTADLTKPYSQVAVNGTMAGGYTVTAQVAVVPDDTVYFIDNGAKPAEQSTSDSPFFDAVKARFGDQILNGKADQKYSEADGYGYTGKIGDPNSDSSAAYGIRNGEGINGNGYYGNGDRKMPYRLKLDAGTYKITTGHEEWWTATRTMTVDVTAGSQKLSAKVTVNKNTPHAESAIELTLKETSDVNIDVYGSGAVLAWIAVEKLQVSDDDITGIATKQLGTAVVKGEGAVDLAAALPKTLDFTTRGGQTVTRDVKWDVPDASKLTTFDAVDVTGTAEGYEGKITYHVEIVPENLVYFIDSGTADKESPAYDAVKAATPGLKNDKSDQQSVDGSWGANISDVSTYGSGADKYATALGGEKDSAKKDIVYTLPMEAGTYRFTYGLAELWTGPRSVKLTLNYTDKDGKSQTVQLNDGNALIVSKKEGTSDPAKLAYTSDPIEIGDGTVTLTAAHGGSGDAGLANWIAVAGKADETPVPPEPETRLTGLKVDASGAKTEYKVGESFDKSGLKVTAVYTTGDKTEERNIEPDDAKLAFAGFDSSKAVESQTVTVTYTDGSGAKASAEFAVTITEDSTPVPPEPEPEPEPEVDLTISADASHDFLKKGVASDGEIVFQEPAEVKGFTNREIVTAPKAGKAWLASVHYRADGAKSGEYPFTVRYTMPGGKLIDVVYTPSVTSEDQGGAPDDGDQDGDQGGDQDGDQGDQDDDQDDTQDGNQDVPGDNQGDQDNNQSGQDNNHGAQDNDNRADGADALVKTGAAVSAVLGVAVLLAIAGVTALMRRRHSGKGGI